jgi:hypothetical protein
MFARLGKFLGKLLGNFFYWISWILTVIVLAQAIILSVVTGNPLIPIILGVAGVTVWLIGIGLRYILARRPNKGQPQMPRLTWANQTRQYVTTRWAGWRRVKDDNLPDESRSAPGTSEP